MTALPTPISLRLISAWSTLLLITQVDRSIPIKPHPDEVDDVKWVSLSEMDAMMDDPGAFLYSRIDNLSRPGTARQRKIRTRIALLQQSYLM